MKKILLGLMMVFSLVACGDKTQKQSVNGKQTIKIGGIFPLSGPQAAMGESAKAGMLKALSEYNQDELHYNYELVFEDNQGKLPTMPSITNKMISSDQVNAIGTMTSAYAKVIAPIADQHGVVQWVSSFEEKNYERFGKYAFVQGLSTQDVAAKIYKWLKDDSADNLAVFAQNAGVVASVTANLENKLKQSNTKYIINSFNPGERDFRLTIVSNKEKGFTKFIIIGFPPEKEIILKQLYEAQIAKDDVLGLCLDMTEPNNLYEDMKTITRNQGQQEFIDNIVKEYNLSSTFGTADSYDFVNLMVDAYEHLYKEGEKPSADKITAYIQAKKKYKCMSGECVVDNNGFIITQPRFRVCKNLKWQYVD